MGGIALPLLDVCIMSVIRDYKQLKSENIAPSGELLLLLRLLVSACWRRSGRLQTTGRILSQESEISPQC